MSEIQPVKLSSAEKLRIYFFPNNEKVVLAEVTHFIARPSGSHRLTTSDGKQHIIPTGWLHIEIDVLDFTV